MGRVCEDDLLALSAGVRPAALSSVEIRREQIVVAGLVVTVGAVVVERERRQPGAVLEVVAVLAFQRLLAEVHVMGVIGHSAAVAKHVDDHLATD